MSIIKKYGGVSTDTSWVNELNVIEKKYERKHSYLDSQRDSESVASSIQEEAYQRIKQKYLMTGSMSSQGENSPFKKRSAHHDQVRAHEVVISDPRGDSE